MEEKHMQAERLPEAAKPEKKNRLPGPGGKKKYKRLISVTVVLLAAVLLGSQVWKLKSGTAPQAVPYETEPVQQRDLGVTVTGSATLEPADAYQVGTLVSGTILSAPFEEDQQVEKDTLLYTLDSGSAQDSVARANISVEQARLSYQQALEAQTPTAPISGILNEVYVHDGDSVSAGTALAKIVASTDLTIDFLFTYASPDQFYAGQPATVFIGNFDGTVQGTVVSVSDNTSVTSNGKQSCTVRVKLPNPGIVSDSFTASAVIGSYTSYGNAPISMAASAVVYASGSGTVSGFSKLAGSTVTKGEQLCTVDSESIRSQLATAKLTVESAQLSAGTAASAVDDYTIRSPIAGTVIEKNCKAGDKVDGASSGTLAVIYDLSYLKMEMNVNELDIGKVRPGQTVEITAAALPGQTFTGTVERVSVNGTTTSGFTTYPVTIVLEEYGDLKPGMNVSATILGDTAKHVLAVPVAAVNRGNTVLVAGAGALGEDGTTVVDLSKAEERPVTLGRSDAEYIEITEGLTAGDTVLVPAQPAETEG